MGVEPTSFKSTTWPFTIKILHKLPPAGFEPALLPWKSNVLTRLDERGNLYKIYKDELYLTYFFI